MPFAAQHRGQRLRDVVDDYKTRATAGVIDYGFHLIVTDASQTTLDEDAAGSGPRGLHLGEDLPDYDALRLDDKAALDVFTAVRREGAVPLVHAESHDMIAWFMDQLIRAGHTEIRNLAVARPVLAERDAVHHAISLAELAGVPMVLVHMSSKDAVEQVRWAQQRGMPVFAEDLPAVPGADGRHPRCAAAAGGAVLLQPAAARRKQPGRALGGTAGRQRLHPVLRSLGVPPGRRRRQAARWPRHAVQPDLQRPPGPGEHGCRWCFPKASTKEGCRLSASLRCQRRSGAALRPVAAEEHDCRWLRRRHCVVGSAQTNHSSRNDTERWPQLDAL